MNETLPLSALDFAVIALYFAVVLCVKVLWPSLSWETGTLVQIGVCFAGYFAGALFGTSKRERETKESLFKELTRLPVAGWHCGSEEGTLS